MWANTYVLEYSYDSRYSEWAWKRGFQRKVERI